MTLRRAHFRGDLHEINGWTVDDRGIVVDGDFGEKPPLGTISTDKYLCVEGVLLPRNEDGSLQYDEHTKIAPEAAEGLIRQLQEAQEASRGVIKLCHQNAPMEQIDRADDKASLLWLGYRNSKSRAAAEWLKNNVVKAVRGLVEEVRHEVQARHRMQDDGCPHGE